MSALSHSASSPAPATDRSDYDAFAAIYSRWIGRDFAARTAPVIHRLLAQHVEHGASILDLCCGCGHVAKFLMGCGYRITGLDASPKMLQLARKNVPFATFVKGDAREFTLPEKFAAVISTFNSLAHVRTDELQRVFASVRSALLGDGVFLFDLTLEESYLARWKGSFTSVADDHVCVVRPCYDEKSRVATNAVTAFEPAGRDGQWRRSDFVIVQNCHPIEAVEMALAQSGFTSLQTFDSERDLGISGEAGRAFFLCK
jgi:SAM-dependent methyltransferase